MSPTKSAYEIAYEALLEHVRGVPASALAAAADAALEALGAAGLLVGTEVEDDDGWAVLP